MKRNGAKSVEALQAGAVKALKKAVAKALARHKLAKVPAAVWRDGKVVYLSGRQPKGRRR